MTCSPAEPETSFTTPAMGVEVGVKVCVGVEVWVKVMVAVLVGVAVAHIVRDVLPMMVLPPHK